MKKLMIAAAAVALAGVTFAECDTPVPCAYAYRIKLAGKTVVGKAKTTGSDATCDLQKNCWAKPASLRIAGYIYGHTTESGAESTCDLGCGCNAFDQVENMIFWDANKAEVTFEAVEFATFEILRNGGLKNKAQILITMDGLNLAGFGVFNPKSKKLKSANGFFAGKLAAPVCSDCTEDTDCTITCQDTTARVFAPCELDTDVESAAAIAYGRWSLTYRQDKVDAYSKNGDISVFKPAKFKAAEGSTNADEGTNE